MQKDLVMKQQQKKMDEKGENKMCRLKNLEISVYMGLNRHSGSDPVLDQHISQSLKYRLGVDKVGQSVPDEI